MDETFVSSVRSAGDLAGVFECDGDTGCFYLYDSGSRERQKILGAIFIFSGDPGLSPTDLAIRWDSAEEKVGLFIEGRLWALFDRRGARWGGGYQHGTSPSLPPDAEVGF